jgi:hypothetical protein
LVLNNTFFENDSNQDGNGELWLQFDVRDNVIKNNIFVANSQSWLITNPYRQNENNVVDYNLYFAPEGSRFSEWGWKDRMYQGFAAYQAGTGNDTHSAFANPMFLNPAVPDLHLSAASPAIDAGTNLAEAGGIDFAGRRRIINAIIDLGAYEFGAVEIGYLPFVSTPAKTAAVLAKRPISP